MYAQRRRRRLLLTMSGGAPLTFASYMTSLNPLLWLRTNEISGTTIANAGSLGAAADGTFTPGSGSLGTTTPIGANSGITLDGATSIITVPNPASIWALTEMTYGMLINPTSAGESSIGHLITTANGTARAWRINSASLPLDSFVTSNATAADSNTNNSFIALSTVQFVFFTFSNSGDRKIRHYKYVSGALTEATYATQTAMTGTIAVPSQDLTIGGRAAGAFCFNGIISNPFIYNGVLTTTQMAQIGALAGL